jgi:endonuclease V-like protein UPF0215 family
MTRRISNVVGVDDAPFERAHRGDVPIVGAVVARTRLDGVLVDRVRRDGANSTARIAQMIRRSPFYEHVQAVLLNGIAVAGFNVVDLAALRALLDRPVLAVARKAPDLAAIERALRSRVPGAGRKWGLIVAAGPMEPIEGVWVQRAGLSPAEAAQLLRDGRVQGLLPEALRIAHLVAGALATGTSRGGA